MLYELPPARFAELPLGPRLAWSECGDPAGRPLLYLHGCPGSRLESVLLHEPALRLGIRVLGVDRPGYGLSPSLPAPGLDSAARLFSDFVDFLGLAALPVMGLSGGAPYALALAAARPRQVDSLALVCPLGPLRPNSLLRNMFLPTRLALTLLRPAPLLVRPVLSLLRALLLRDPKRAVAAVARFAPSPDDTALAHEHVAEGLGGSMAEALRPGLSGVVADILAYSAPWPFDLVRIAAPVRLWHGGKDHTAPPAMAEHLARSLPNAKLRLFPQEGHFSLPLRHMDHILETFRTVCMAESQSGSEKRPPTQ